MAAREVAGRIKSPARNRSPAPAARRRTLRREKDVTRGMLMTLLLGTVRL
ncbi:MAG: hypothetical protein AB9872_11310 [Solidesulfovibrio sp.]